MTFAHYIHSGAKRLRCGYTTGTCAALAAAGAARLLLTGSPPDTLSLRTPKGWTVEVVPRYCRMEGDGALCAVEKDAGDDPDVTDGCVVEAAVRFAAAEARPGTKNADTDGGAVTGGGITADGGAVTGGGAVPDGGAVTGGRITVDGGAGVGRVTRPGLDQPVGAAAINRVPRQMIIEAVEAVRDAAGYDGGLSVTISVPGGEKLAQRTMNPRLGIVGGISILGTSGVVEPMSDRAVEDTVVLEVRQALASGTASGMLASGTMVSGSAVSGTAASGTAASGTAVSGTAVSGTAASGTAVHETRLLLTPGNYGLSFLRRTGLDALGVPVVRMGNYVGSALDAAAGAGARTILLAGHLGKLVKLAGGIMNTHSRWADCRGELFCAHCAVCGGDGTLCRALLDAPTSDACLALLDGAGLRRAVLDSLLCAIQRHLDQRAEGLYRAGAAVFSNQYGFLGLTVGGRDILSEWDPDGTVNLKLYGQDMDSL